MSAEQVQTQSGYRAVRPLGALLRERALPVALIVILLALAVMPIVSLVTNEIASDRRATLRDDIRPFVDEVERTQIAVTELAAEANRFAFGGDLLTAQRYQALRSAALVRFERLRAAGAR